MTPPSLHRSILVNPTDERPDGDWHGWMVAGELTTDADRYDRERRRLGFP